jgi:hypothetical protein
MVLIDTWNMVVWLIRCDVYVMSQIFAVDDNNFSVRLTSPKGSGGCPDNGKKNSHETW